MTSQAVASPSTFIPETVRFLLGLARDCASGTLGVQFGEDRLVFSVNQGRVRDAAFPDESTLERVFAALVSPADHKKALKLAAKNGTSIGDAILELGLVDADRASDAVVGFLSDTFAQVLACPQEGIDFTPSEGGEGYLSDLGANYEIYLPIEELLLKALGQAQAWDFVVENFSILRDVYYATPNAVHFFHRQQECPTEMAVLQILDGQNDVQEVITASGLDPFDGLRVVQELAEGGYVELVNPVQLFQLGLASEEGGNWTKALSLYQRALERGLDDFDLQFRLAHACEMTGQTTAAISRYLEFADKCAREFRFDDTLRAFHKIIELDQSNIPIRRRYIQLLYKYEKKEQAAKESLDLAEMLHDTGRDDEAVRLLKEALKACPDDAALQERYVKLCDACGAADEARNAKEQLAKIYTDRKDTSKALEYFQRLFVEGEDTLDVRAKLIELHAVQGNRDKALQHLDAVLAFGNPYGIRDSERLRALHQKRCELRPGDRDSSWHLIEDMLARKDLPGAEKLLRELAARLGMPEDRAELIMALKRLQRIVPEKNEYRWQLAKEYEKAGNEKEAVAALRHVATLSVTAGELSEAERALRDVLRIAPFEREAREELVAVLARMNEKDKRLEVQRQLALLRLIGGEIDKAQALCREIVSDRTEDAFLLLLLADACARTGDARMAAEQYGRAGKMLLAERNIGLARCCLEKLRTLGAHAALVEELQKGIDETARPAAAPAAAPSAPAPLRLSETAAGRPQEAGAQDEAFATMKQRVLKRSVSSITSRLRNIKTGKPSAEGGGQAVKLSVSSALNKLKTLNSAGGMAPKDEQQEDGPAPTPKEPAKPVKLGSATDKLKALKGGGGMPKPPATEAHAGTSAAPATDAAKAEAVSEINVTPDVTRPAKLGGAAARLAALKAKKSQDSADTPAPVAVP